jgi:hypothetical protein
MTDNPNSQLCCSGRHAWRDPEDRARCCAGYRRVQSHSRTDLEQLGARHIVLAQMWRGWVRDDRRPPS